MGRLPDNNIENCISSMHYQRGFVLTVEFILITTILIIGCVVGVIAIRDALIKYKFKQMDRRVMITDSNNQVLGPMVGFDEHESPLLFLIDRTLPPDDEGKSQVFRVLIGIRDDRFTSREPIYYTRLNCQGDPCIKPTSNEVLDSRGVDIASTNTGAVGYFHALQDGPNYAIGRDPNGGTRGFLYRETLEACPVTALSAATGSRYMSQKVVSQESCESPFVLPLPVGEAPLLCPEEGVSTLICAPGCGIDSGACACPANWHPSGAGLLAGNTLYCCPDGSDIDPDSILNLDGPLCTGIGLVKAESVPDSNDSTRNALENFQLPFRVNLPATAANGDGWRSVPPESENQP